MPQYSYRAISQQDGSKQDGVLDAASEQAVVAQLQSQHLLPVSIEVNVAMAAGKKSGKLSTKDQLDIARGMNNLLGAGIPVDQAMGMMIDLADNDRQVAVLSEWREALRDGSSLSEAIENSSAGTSGFFVSMVKAGEASGALDVALERLSEYLERAKALRDTVVSAMIYPAILLAVAVISVIILLAYVVPQFKDLFEDMGAALPLPTQIVVASGDFLAAWWWALIGAFFAIGWLWRRAMEKPPFRLKVDQRLLKMPLVSGIVIRLDVSRFAFTLSTLTQNGVALTEAMQIVIQTVGNTAMQQQLRYVLEQIKEGSRLATALADSSFPKLAIQLIKIGEETGKLEQMLAQIGEIYDEELQAQVKRLVALMEPVLILTLGMVIAGIIMSVLMAILAVNDLAF